MDDDEINLNAIHEEMCLFKDTFWECRDEDGNSRIIDTAQVRVISDFYIKPIFSYFEERGMLSFNIRKQDGAVLRSVEYNLTITEKGKQFLSAWVDMQDI